MDFEWDENKNRQNQRKHGVSFEEAQEIFFRIVFTSIDERYDDGEIREISIGAIQGIVIVTVAHILLEKQHPKKGKSIMNILPKRLKEIQNIPDSAIDTSDIPELEDQFWENAEMVKPVTKKLISIRLDSDILDWFKSQGKGYQSLINNVLLSYVSHHQNK